MRPPNPLSRTAIVCEDRGVATTEIKGACPLDCPDCCSWTVTVEDGQAVKLRGAKDHPFTRGGLCTKMNPYLDYSARSDRVLHPMRRIGAKGEGRFEPISWDEAIDEWADRWQQIIAESGGDAIWPFSGTGNLGLLQGEAGGQRLFNALGLARHHVSICSVAGTLGLLYAMGTGATFDPEELPDAGLIILWGANPLVSHQHLWPFVAEAQASGAPVVCIDPVRTRSARRADAHLAPRPGTDGALALGIMAELVARDGCDDEFLAGRTLGFDEFRSSLLRDWDAERAARVCGLDEHEVTSLVDLIVEHRPLAIKLSMGMQRHAGGGQAARVIAAIPAITGDHDRPAGGLAYSTSMHFGIDGPRLSRPDLRPEGTGRTLVMTRLADTLLDEPDPVRSLFVVAANPVVSNPDQHRVRAALSRDDLFTVVADHFQTPTADYADLLLPATTQIEHHELLTAYGHLYLHWNEAAVAPRGEALPLTEMLRRLAGRLGLTEPALFASDEELARDALVDVDFDDLRSRGWMRLPHDRPFAPHAARFSTQSGRFEFASAAAERDGHGRLPHYVPPAEATSTDERHPFALVSPARAETLNSTFGSPDAEEVHLHPSDAETLGLADGTEVDVGNDRGSFHAVAVVSDISRPGVITGSKGRWPGADRPSVNATVAERDADMGHGAVYHDNHVWIRPG